MDSCITVSVASGQSNLCFENVESNAVSSRRSGLLII